MSSFPFNQMNCLNYCNHLAFSFAAKELKFPKIVHFYALDLVS